MATLTAAESGNAWSIFRKEAWLQVAVGVIEDVGESHAVCLTVARLHDRLLGCRYSIDEDGGLFLRSDIYPHDQSGLAVGTAVLQMQWIVDLTFDLLKRVKQSGQPASDADIDDAFRLGLGDGPD